MTNDECARVTKWYVCSGLSGIPALQAGCLRGCPTQPAGLGYGIPRLWRWLSDLAGRTIRHSGFVIGHSSFPSDPTQPAGLGLPRLWRRLSDLVGWTIRHSGFVILSSFVIGHSSFAADSSFAKPVEIAGYTASPIANGRHGCLVIR